MAYSNLTGLAKEVSDSGLKDMQRIVVVRMDQMQEDPDEVSGSGFAET